MSKAGLVIPKSLGLLTPPTPGSTNPDEVRKEQKIERKRAGDGFVSGGSGSEVSQVRGRA
jgi:hypothetical protein